MARSTILNGSLAIILLWPDEPNYKLSILATPMLCLATLVLDCLQASKPAFSATKNTIGFGLAQKPTGC